MTVTVLTPNYYIREDDLMAHIEDTRLFWVFRNGRTVKRAWNELSCVEQQQQIEAEARAAYCTSFDIY